MALKGLVYFRRKLSQKRQRVNLRYAFYEMKNTTKDFNISTPPDLRSWMSCLGWCSKAVDTLANRIVFTGYKNDNYGINEIYQMNNPDILFDSAILDAMIGGCSFIYIAPDAEGFPRLQVLSCANATGEIDPITGMLKEGYAVLERDAYERPILEAYFVPGRIEYIYSTGERITTYNSAPYCLLVPVIYKPDAKRPFGHSRISRACMSIVGSAIRTVKRSEISAEFFSFPQKYITGLSEDAEISDKWLATMSAFMSFSKDADGESPKVGQFAQQSMTPHLEQLRMFASLFAGETDLTLDDLGFASGNPSSSDAIMYSHENLRLKAEDAERKFGTGFLNAGYLASCVRDDYPYSRQLLHMTEATWKPIFKPSAAAISGIGDALVKIEQAHPGYITDEKLKELIGF